MNKVYIRVSTEKQEYDRQIYLLAERGYTEENSTFYTETFSGKTKKRPILTKMLNELKPGDTVVIESLSRLARSVKDLCEIGETITVRDCTLISLKENFDMETSLGKLLFNLMGSINQFERDVLADRTKEALAAKKKNGMVLGRPKTIPVEIMDQAVNEYMTTKQSYLEVASHFGISNATLFYEVKKRGLERLPKTVKGGS